MAYLITHVDEGGTAERYTTTVAPEIANLRNS
jgi:hypothetical protein